MRVLLLFCLCVAVTSAEDGVVADTCKVNDCKIENNCRCSTSPSPLLNGSLTEYPQLISLTFDESVTADIVASYWEPLLFNLANPDNKAIGATFFVPHEYTDYEMVNQLYNMGFEIAVHSITKNSQQSYWRTASESLLEQEFGGQRTIISKFANIPIDSITGVRTPQLQLAGNNSVKAYVNSKLAYDSSWPTIPAKRLFPYTLDYLSTQECTLGAECPNEAFKGFWILPINDLNGAEKECNSLASCNVTGTAEEISKWLMGEINDVRSKSRVPLTLLINSYWFDFTQNSYEALANTLNKLLDLKDVFFVSQNQVLEWIKNPVKLVDFQTEVPDVSATCNSVTCLLKNADGNERYMQSCVPCPAAYPWLGNPNGDATVSFSDE